MEGNITEKTPQSNIIQLIQWSKLWKDTIGSRLEDIQTYQHWDARYYTFHIDRAFEAINIVQLTDFIRPQIDKAKALRGSKGCETKANLEQCLQILYPIIAALADNNNREDRAKIVANYGIFLNNFPLYYRNLILTL